MNDRDVQVVREQIECLKSAGRNEYRHHQYDAALKTFAELKEFGHKNNDDETQGFAFYCIAMCYREKAENGEPRFWNDSMLNFETSLIFYASGAQPIKKERSKILGKMAYVQRTLGFYNRAMRSVDEAIELSRETMDRMRLAEILNDKATMLMESGSYDAAREIFRENMNLLTELEAEYKSLSDAEKPRLSSVPQELAREYNNMGECSRLERDFQKAEDYFKKCLEATSQIIDEDPRAQAEMYAYLGLGKCYAQTNTSPDEALENSRKARVIAEKIGHLKEVASSYKIDALVSENAGDFDASISTYKRVLVLYEEKLGIVRDKAMVLAEIGDTYLKAEQYDEARDSFMKSREAFKLMGMATHVAFVEKLETKVKH